MNKSMIAVSLPLLGHAAILAFICMLSWPALAQNVTEPLVPTTGAMSVTTAGEQDDEKNSRSAPSELHSDAESENVAAPLVPDYALTLEQLGARYPFNLRGIDGSDSVPFNIRADEVVTAAQVDLSYSYSPALLADLSHLNVLVNDEVAFTIPVPREEAGTSLRRTVELPPHLITEFNTLRFQLIGHYTLECEDPLHSSLWANISNKSTLALTVEHVPLPDDLSILPLPLFDHRDSRGVTLPIVFENEKSAAVLESAGMVASWFGAMAAYRGARFPVHWNGGFPVEGSAVVLSVGDNPGMSARLPTISGPTLAMTTNPNDERGKLLWVMGRDAQELRLAAEALVTGGVTLSGQVATIRDYERRLPRQAYDAPNWLTTDRPIKFGELISEQALDVRGYEAGPVRIPLQLPPDLFGWREKPVPVDLRYRYTPQPGHTNSSLLVSVDQQFLKSFPLPSVDQIKDESWLTSLTEHDMLPVRAQMHVPLERLLAQAELELRFMYDYIKEGQCRDIIIDNVRGRIDPESTIDFSHYPHFMPLPDLKAFSESGFPFTRYADLSQTAVVLATDPAEEDVATYLGLMGRFGKSTGYPTTHVTVAFGEPGLSMADKDLVVVASGEQPWLASWSDYLPAVLAGDDKRFATSDAVFMPIYWKTPDPRQVQRHAHTALQYSSTGDSVVFVGIESPAAEGRSAVLITSSEPAGQKLAVDFLTTDKGADRLWGSLAVVHEGGVTPLAAEYSYSTGQLGFWRGIQWAIATQWPTLLSFWWLGAVLAAFVLLLVMVLLWRFASRRRADRRNNAQG